MNINGEQLNYVDTFDTYMTVPDCIVAAKNKLGGGHGEAKFYIASKDTMREFYGGEGFCAKCFILKSDLINYMIAIKSEYLHPSQNYRGKNEMAALWSARMDKVQMLDDVIMFDIYDQTQINGPRGYVNSNDFGYQIIRELSLPLVSYITAVKLVDLSGSILYYWKLFVDFDAIAEKEKALVFVYGKKQGQDNATAQLPESNVIETEKQKQIRYARYGQGKYREAMLEDCMYICPITMINDERLLIASHAKPYAVSNDDEKIDPKNGFILSALMDKLFDRGFITFSDDKRLILSQQISPKNWERMGLKNGQYIQALPLDDARKVYLDFHRKAVFHGMIDANIHVHIETYNDNSRHININS